MRRAHRFIAVMIVCVAGGSAVPAGEVISRGITGEPVATAATQRPAAITRSPGWLGVSVQDGASQADPNSKVQSSYRWGAEIGAVAPGSPAAKAGLQPGDLILRVGDRRIGDSQDLVREINALETGTETTLKIMRDGEERDLSVTLGERPADPAPRQRGAAPQAFAPGSFNSPPFGNFAPFGGAFAPGSDPFAIMQQQMELLQRQMDQLRNPPSQSFGSTRIQGSGGGVFRTTTATVTSTDSRTGLTLQGLTPQLREFFGAQEEQGLLVAAVEDNSPAAAAGLRAGDVIVSVDATPVGDPTQGMNLLSPPNVDSVEVTYLRDKQPRTVKLDLGEGL